MQEERNPVLNAAAEAAKKTKTRTISGKGTAYRVNGTEVNPNGGIIEFKTRSDVENEPAPAALSSVPKNAMTKTRSAGNPNGGTTYISGNPQIVMNGETVNGTGADIGDLASVTAGLSKLRQKYGTEALGKRLGKPAVSLDETSGNVLLNGKDSGLRAADYAGGADDRTAAEGWANATGDSLPQVSTYAGLTDLGDIVKWSDDKVTIGGIDVPYAYVDKDGRAYASKSAIDSAAAQVRADTGIQNPTKLTDNTMNRYSSSVNKALDKVVNRSTWTYNPEKDPAYQAYAKQYSRNAEQLYNRAMGAGGLYSSPNSYQMYQALAAYGDNMQQLSDAVPQLAQQDYARYSDEQTRNRAALEALQNERKLNLDAATAANDNMYNRYRAADELNYNRRQDARFGDKKQDNELIKQNKELTKLDQEIELGEDSVSQSKEYTSRYPTMLDLEVSLKRGELTASDLANTMSMINIAAQRAQLRNGIFSKSDMDALGIEQDMSKYPNSNGYPTVYSAEVQRLLAIWNNVDKVKALFSMGM